MLRTLRYFLIESTFERGVRACAREIRQKLTEQRRMVEPIARFVKDPIYKGAYRSPDANTLARLGVLPLVCQAFPKPVTFLNTEFRGRDAAEEMVGTGFVNELEVQWIVDACEEFERGLARSSAPPPTVSILCFYRDQARRVRARIAERHRSFQRLNFRVIDAIDRIQGQESDLVFISFCRARSPRRPLSPNFGMWLRDPRRLNVAFTRARRALVLVGHRPTLRRLGEHQHFYANLFSLFEAHPNDMQMIEDFGAKRRRR
ncbi:MAG: C-terminal helicase domain-containing protein [Byssovorax sp.]